jgi:hypothetical protein
MVDPGERPRTPENSYNNNINVVDVYDLQHRACKAEQELAIERHKHTREKRRTRRCQTQINEYMEALNRSTQDCMQLMNQCQVLSNSSMALSQELWKAKLMVETLEAVIMMFYKSLLEMKTGTRVSGFNEDVATT